MVSVNRKEIVSVRLPKGMLEGLEEVSKFNGSNRTTEIERYIREGLEKSRRILEKKFVSYSIMILAIASLGLWIWYLFNI